MAPLFYLLFSRVANSIELSEKLIDKVSAIKSAESGETGYSVTN